MIADVGGRDVRVFASIAHRLDTGTSDVDRLIKLPSGLELFALVDLGQWLEDVLGVRVDGVIDMIVWATLAVDLPALVEALGDASADDEAAEVEDLCGAHELLALP